MHYRHIIAGAGLAQLALGQVRVDEPLDKRQVSLGGVSVGLVTVTKTVTAPCSATTKAAASTTKATSAASSAAAAASTGVATISKKNLTPNGRKAGLSGFVNIHYYPAFDQLAPYISWYSDYYPNTPDWSGVKGVGMLWGAPGSGCVGVYEDAYNTFQSTYGNGKKAPDIMFGYYEPDCFCTSSSQMSVTSAAANWNSTLAPLSAKGTVLGSPSMCKQYDEDFLTPFKAATAVPWDVTSIHINKPTLSEVQADVDYYWNKYGKPIWVSEFACVHDHPTFLPCTDQTEIVNFINAVVPYLQNHPHVVAYGASNGEGLGTTWPLVDTVTGNLSTTGLAYLNAIKQT